MPQKHPSLTYETILTQTNPLIAASSCFTLIFSIIFNYGYFYAIGIKYLEFLTITDHLLSAIIMLPGVLMVSAVSAFSIYALGHVPKISRIILSPILLRFGRQYQTPPHVEMIISAISISAVIPIMYWIFPHSAMYLIISVAPLVINQYIWVIFQLINIRGIAVFAPVVFVNIIGYSFYFGFLIGQYDIHKKTRTTVVTHTDDSVRFGAILRNIENGIFFQEQHDRPVLFLQWETIKFLSSPPPQAPSLLPNCATWVFSATFAKQTISHNFSTNSNNQWLMTESIKSQILVYS